MPRRNHRLYVNKFNDTNTYKLGVDKGKVHGLSNPFEEPSYKLNFNMNLEFDYTKPSNVETYHTLMGGYVYRIAKDSIPFKETPWVKYQSDVYIREDRARDKVTMHPTSMYAMEIISKPQMDLTKENWEATIIGQQPSVDVAKDQVRLLPLFHLRT